MAQQAGTRPGHRQRHHSVHRQHQRRHRWHRCRRRRCHQHQRRLCQRLRQHNQCRHYCLRCHPLPHQHQFRRMGLRQQRTSSMRPRQTRSHVPVATNAAVGKPPPQQWPPQSSQWHLHIPPRRRLPYRCLKRARRTLSPQIRLYDRPRWMTRCQCTTAMRICGCGGTRGARPSRAGAAGIMDMGVQSPKPLQMGPLLIVC